MDLAVRYDLKSQLLLLFSPFLFPPKKEGRGKGEWIKKIVNLRHVFLLDQINGCKSALNVIEGNTRASISFYGYTYKTWMYKNICFLLKKCHF